MAKLTSIQQRFIAILLEYPELDPAEAYIQASGKPGMKHRVAASSAARLLKNVAVQDALADVQHLVETRRNEQLAVTVENVLARYGQIAFGKVTDVVTAKLYEDPETKLPLQRVVLKKASTDDFPHELQVMIKGIKEKITAQGDRLVEIEFHDQLRAMEALARYAGIWRDNILSSQVVMNFVQIEKRHVD